VTGSKFIGFPSEVLKRIIQEMGDQRRMFEYQVGRAKLFDAFLRLMKRASRVDDFMLL
jgi:hypothetical protein